MESSLYDVPTLWIIYKFATQDALYILYNYLYTLQIKILDLKNGERMVVSKNYLKEETIDSFNPGRSRPSVPRSKMKSCKVSTYVCVGGVYV